MSSDPLGAYFKTPKSGIGDYFATTPGGELTGIGRSPDGLGKTGKQGFLSLSPAVRDIRRLTAVRQQRRALRGLGAEGDAPVPVVTETGISPGMMAAGIVLGTVVRGACGYAVGKAVAPSADKEKSYARWGIVIGIFGGVLGMGIQAAVALSKR